MPTLDELIAALEAGGKTDGRGFRVISYDAKWTGKAARNGILEQLHRLKGLED